MVDIIVCIKQVPDTQNIRINPQTNTLIREGVKSIINPFDMYALEEAIRLKEKYGGSVIAISMGPSQVEESLREAISIGADDAYMVSDKAFSGSDTFATSFTLAKTIQHIIGRFDIIICGKQTTDGDTAQVGPGIAAHLNLPQIMFVRKIQEIKTHSSETCSMKARMERITEEGYEILDTPLPVVISVAQEINEPRLPSLKGKIKAKNMAIKKITLADLKVKEDDVGLKGSPTQVVKIFTPVLRKPGQILTGDMSEAISKLAEEIKKVITGADM
jgi:electron transfer flavoprotein beta subunit